MNGKKAGGKTRRAPKSKLVSVYITAPDVEAARRIGRELVENRLAACVNILPSIRSIYWWDGAVQEEGESAMIAKTRGEQLESLIRKVRGIHPYEVPCVVAWPIVDGTSDYLAWVDKETRPMAQRRRPPSKPERSRK